MNEGTVEAMDAMAQGMCALAMSLAWTMGPEHAAKFSRGLALIAAQYEELGETTKEHMVMLLHEASKLQKHPSLD